MPEKPQRITLSRAKGWRMPPNTVKVDRSTKWGNPYVVGGTVENHLGREFPIRTAQDAVNAYRNMIIGGAFAPIFGRYMGRMLRLTELRGKNLACWCRPGAPCHADVLLELANREEPA